MAARRGLAELSHLRLASPAACPRTDHVASSLVRQQTPHGTGAVCWPKYLTMQRTVSTSLPPAGAVVGAALTDSGRVLLHGVHDLPYEPQVSLRPPHATLYIELVGAAASWPRHPIPRSRPRRCMAHTSRSQRGLIANDHLSCCIITSLLTPTHKIVPGRYLSM